MSLFTEMFVYQYFWLLFFLFYLLTSHAYHLSIYLLFIFHRIVLVVRKCRIKKNIRSTGDNYNYMTRLVARSKIKLSKSECILFVDVLIMNTLIRRKSEQWLDLDRQEDRHVQYEQQ